MDALSILLVDDDRNLARTLSYGLQKAMGKTVSVAVCFSGSEALSSLATDRFDVVISDLGMPGLTGDELLHKIREDHHEMILVLITAYGTEALKEQVRRRGIGYLAKPFELSRLVQIIHEEWSRDRTENRLPALTRLEGSA